jgi:hypothetical protein
MYYLIVQIQGYVLLTNTNNCILHRKVNKKIKQKKEKKNKKEKKINERKKKKIRHCKNNNWGEKNEKKIK